MSAFTGFILGHPIMSIWMAVIGVVWLFIYAASRASEGPDSSRAPIPMTPAE